VIKFFLILFLLFFDFLSKKLVFTYLDLNSFLTLTSFLDLAHIHNFGISFGLFSGQLPAWFLSLIGIFVTCSIFYMMIQSKNIIEKWALTMIIAGGVSNIFDRIINGYVIDFLYLHYKEMYWPAFNFADIYISIGIVIFLYQVLKDMHKRIFN
jgi:signal peptidase II